MAKRILFASLVLAVVVLSGVAWAQGYTINDVMKEITGVKSELVDLKVEIAGIKSDIDWLRNVTATFFVALFAALAGLFYFVFDISRSLRVPKEERVAKLEAMVGEIKEYLGQVAEKLHLPHIPKSVLLLLLAFSLLSPSLAVITSTRASHSLGAGPQKINFQEC